MDGFEVIARVRCQIAASLLRYIPSFQVLVLLCLAEMPQARAATVAAGVAEQTVIEFVAQSGLSVLISSGRLEHYHTNAVHTDNWQDRETVIKGLHQLLDGTGLVFTFLNAETISVDPESTEVPESEEPATEQSFPDRARPISGAAPVGRALPRKTSSPAQPFASGIEGGRAALHPPQGECQCAQYLSSLGWIDGPWCKYDDGRRAYVPERCPPPEISSR